MVQEQIPFPQRLSEYIRSENITIEVFGARLFDATDGMVRCSASTIHNWLEGRTVPHRGTQEAISRVMGLPASEIFDTEPAKV